MWSWILKILRLNCKAPRPPQFRKLSDEELVSLVNEAAGKVVLSGRYVLLDNINQWVEIDCASEIMKEFVNLAGKVTRGNLTRAAKLCRQHAKQILFGSGT
jgi:hypothetical protein